MKIIERSNYNSISISLFAWNEKYIVKFEDGNFEQTYKFSMLDLSESEIKSWINDTDFSKIEFIFDQMRQIISIE